MTGVTSRAARCSALELREIAPCFWLESFESSRFAAVSAGGERSLVKLVSFLAPNEREETDN